MGSVGQGRREKTTPERNGLLLAVGEGAKLAHVLFFFFFFLIYFWLRWVFVAVRGLSLVAARGLLIAVASLAAEHGL